jgi:hypothetical protein
MKKEKTLLKIEPSVTLLTKKETCTPFASDTYLLFRANGLMGSIANVLK